MGLSLIGIALIGILVAVACGQDEKSFMEELAEQLNANANECQLINQNDMQSIFGKKIECPPYCYAVFLGFMKGDLVDKDEVENKLRATNMDESMAENAAAKCGVINAGDKCSTADALFRCLAKNTSLKEKS